MRQKFSSMQTIKSIHKWRYSLELLQDSRGVFYIVSNNFLSQTKSEASLIDYDMAMHLFETRYNSFEGN